jgi:hypothetical protein
MPLGFENPCLSLRHHPLNERQIWRRRVSWRSTRNTASGRALNCALERLARTAQSCKVTAVCHGAEIAPAFIAPGALKIYADDVAPGGDARHIHICIVEGKRIEQFLRLEDRDARGSIFR